MYVLTEEFRADRKHFSLLLSEWWKGCSHWENKNGKWDRCELVSKPPHQPAQTPMGYRHTSGRNCQWDWYSARMNKKWIVLLRCKHKVTWAIMHLLRFALIPPPYSRSLHSLFYVFLPSANQYDLQVYWLVHAQPQQLEYQTDSPGNTQQIFNTPLKVLSSFSKETRLFLSCKDGISYIAAVQSFFFSVINADGSTQKREAIH